MLSFIYGRLKYHRGQHRRFNGVIREIEAHTYRLITYHSIMVVVVIVVFIYLCLLFMVLDAPVRI